MDGKTGDDFTDIYAYDLAGNRITKAHDQGNDGTIDLTTTDSYDQENRLTNESDSAGNTTLYFYDNNGSSVEILKRDHNQNLIRLDLFSYDARGRALATTAHVAIGRASNIETDYTYDDDDHVIASNTYPVSTPSAAVLTTYLNDNLNPSGYSKPLETWTAGALATTYVLGTAVLAQNSGGVFSYIMPDGHGSTRQLTAYTSDPNTNGHVVARYDYDAFGGTINAGLYQNTADTLFLYVGEILDSSTGDYRMGAREYRTSIGRWVTRDPQVAGVGDLKNANPYVYTHGDPINFVDRSGHFELTETQIVVLGYAMYLGVVLFSLYKIKENLDHLLTMHASSAGEFAPPTSVQMTAEEAHQTAQEIANGHAGSDDPDVGHLAEFEDMGAYDRDTMADIIEDVINNADDHKKLRGQREAWVDWQDDIIVIKNSNPGEEGTAYRPPYSGKDTQTEWDNLE